MITTHVVTAFVIVFFGLFGNETLTLRKLKRFKAMKKSLLFFALICASLLWVINAYGDNVPTEGKWPDEDYRISTPAPPLLTIEGNVLNVHFVDALSDLSIQIQDASGTLFHEELLSGSMGEIIPISLEGWPAGSYQVVLTHKLGWLSGEFTLY